MESTFSCKSGRITTTFIDQGRYFVPSALKDNVGVDPNLAQVIGGTVNVCFIIGSIVPALFLDKLGRRKPMMIGSTGLGISMMMIAILLSINTHATNSASVAFFYVYMLVSRITAH